MPKAIVNKGITRDFRSLFVTYAKSLIMKKISMIELSRRAMGAREMNALTGGNVCGCGCHGPSSTQANANANYKGNKSSNGSQSVVIADMSDGQVEVHNP